MNFALFKPAGYPSLLLLAGCCVHAPSVLAQPKPGHPDQAKHYLAYESSITLPNVHGGFDLMAVDVE